MMSSHPDRGSVFRMRGQSYARDILDALSKRPLRFTDPVEYDPNEKTRAQRLKELESRDMITAARMKIGKRFFVHYTLTSRGKALLSKSKGPTDLARLPF
jgi:DNA-binding HxlR family transcriptional regulator